MEKLTQAAKDKEVEFRIANKKTDNLVGLSVPQSFHLKCFTWIKFDSYALTFLKIDNHLMDLCFLWLWGLLNAATKIP